MDAARLRRCGVAGARDLVGHLAQALRCGTRPPPPPPVIWNSRGNLKFLPNFFASPGFDLLLGPWYSWYRGATLHSQWAASANRRRNHTKMAIFSSSSSNLGSGPEERKASSMRLGVIGLLLSDAAKPLSGGALMLQPYLIQKGWLHEKYQGEKHTLIHRDPTGSTAKGREVVVGLVLFPSSTAHSSSRGKQRHANRHGRGEEEEEAQAQREGEGGEGRRHGHWGGALQAVRGREGHPVRRAVHRQVLHGAPRVTIGAAAAARHPAVVPERAAEPAVHVHHRLHAHQLHHPGAPGVAHAHARPGHQEVQGGALRVRVRGHEGGRGPAVAGHDPAWGRQQEAHPRAHRQRDGTVQVQEGLPHHLRLRRAPAGRGRLHVRRRPQEDTAGGGGAQGFLRSHRHARHAQPEEHRLAVPVAVAH